MQRQSADAKSGHWDACVLMEAQTQKAAACGTSCGTMMAVHRRYWQLQHTSASGDAGVNQDI